MSLLSKINIQIKGKQLKGFRSVSINQNLYGEDYFEIICRYDSIEELNGFMVENSKEFLGSPVVIQTKIKDNSDEKDGINFLGFVTKIQSNRSGLFDADSIVISGGSKEIALDRKPLNRAFLDMKLEDIVKEVLKDYPLKTKINTRNKQEFPYIVQFEESDLVFLRRLSIRYGEWFYMNGDEAVFGEIPVVERGLTLGFNLKGFRYDLKVAPVKFSLYALDPLKQSVYRYHSGNSKTENNLNAYGKHALKKSREMYPLESTDYYEHLNSEETDHKNGLDSVGEICEAADAVNLTSVCGSSDNSFLSIGNYVKINGIKEDGKTKTDYGRYLVTSIQHTLDNTLNYSNSFTAIPGETAIPENTDPYFVRTSSNQVGLIADNKDPKKLGRVKVSFCWMEGKQMTPWVKILTPYVHVDAGFYFIPSENSRVLVGFEDGDVERPYCLGNLFDEDTKPDSKWAGSYNKGKDAKIHAIRTRSGQTIELQDDQGNEKIRIYDTFGNNEITLDSAKGEVFIKASGKLTLTASDIEINAENNINVEAKNKLDQKAIDINTEASSSLKEKGASIEIKANGTLKAVGSATAEISSSGITTIKGSMVKIN